VTDDPPASQKPETDELGYVNGPYGYHDLLSLRDRLVDFPHPWFVCGGWAVDLFLGEVTRDHSDIEIGIYRHDQAAIRNRFEDWDLEKIVEASDGINKIVPWYAGEWLLLPIHQVRLTNLRVRPPQFEFFLSDADDDNWRFRRMQDIVMPKSRLIHTNVDGIRYVDPAVQLLYKARIMRDKDRHDFELALPRLSPYQRAWLHDALQRFLPDHEWIDRL
jgi:hypothetical protein